jgi:L-lactate dehydrogenase complex protein LldF
MATEEIHLNKHLEDAGYDVVETDLGEFVVQIDHDTPSHIVTPIIHKSRQQVADSFEREGLGPRTESAGELAMQARRHLRDKFRHAEVGISGVNFAIASTGRLVLVENEGNNRYSTTAPRTHIAIMGIEKILPRESDLALFLPLLAASATGQRITTYVHFISGPRREDEADGPEEVHLILLDNGRSKLLQGPFRDILRLRCSAIWQKLRAYAGRARRFARSRSLSRECFSNFGTNLFVKRSGKMASPGSFMVTERSIRLCGGPD